MKKTKVNSNLYFSSPALAGFIVVKLFSSIIEYLPEVDKFFILYRRLLDWLWLPCTGIFCVFENNFQVFR